MTSGLWIADSQWPSALVKRSRFASDVALRIRGESRENAEGGVRNAESGGGAIRLRKGVYDRLKVSPW